MINNADDRYRDQDMNETPTRIVHCAYFAVSPTEVDTEG